MYNYKSLDATYNIEITVLFPDNTERCYCSKVDVHHKKRNKTEWGIILKRKYDTRINGNTLTNIVDKLMKELGESLYPISLKLLEDNNYTIVNNDEIAERWLRKSEHLLEEYPTIEFKNYVEMAISNLRPIYLEKMLVRDTFFQLYLANTNLDLFSVDCFNFPTNGKKIMFYAKCIFNKSNLENKRNYLLFPSFSSSNVKETGGSLLYVFYPEGDICSIEGEFKLTTANSDSYLKRVKITVVNRNIKKGILNI